MLQKFDHSNVNWAFTRGFDYSNVNWVFTRVYAWLSNEHKGTDSLATLSGSLSFNINRDSFNFRWKLLKALPIKGEQE